MKKNLNGPVIYLDPVTMTPTCSPNDCKNKFTKKHIETRELNFVWVGGPITHLYYQSFCEDCNKKMQTTNDKKMTSESIRRAKLNKGIDPLSQNATE